MFGSQVKPFEMAISVVMVEVMKVREVSFQSMTLDDLKTSGFTLKDFVNWLLTSHVHFILGHPHQGLEHCGWSVVDIYSELERLHFHPGFPSGSSLHCPMFTQNKMKYLEALPTNVTMPTFKIPISEDMDLDMSDTHMSETETNISR